MGAGPTAVCAVRRKPASAGSNAWVVEHTRPTTRAVPAGPTVIPLSAESDELLVAFARALCHYLVSVSRDSAGIAFEDVAHTLYHLAQPGDSRCALVAGSVSECVTCLGRVAPNQVVAAASDVPAGLIARARSWLGGEPLPPPGAGRRVWLPPPPLPREPFWKVLSEVTQIGHDDRTTGALTEGDVDDIIRAVASEHLPVGQEYSPSAPLERLGLDSMDVLNVTLDLERKLGVKLPSPKRDTTFAELRDVCWAAMRKAAEHAPGAGHAWSDGGPEG